MLELDKQGGRHAEDADIVPAFPSPAGTASPRERLIPGNPPVEIVPVPNRFRLCSGTIKPAEMLGQNRSRERPLRGKEIAGNDFPPAEAKAGDGQPTPPQRVQGREAVSARPVVSSKSVGRPGAPIGGARRNPAGARLGRGCTRQWRALGPRPRRQDPVSTNGGIPAMNTADGRVLTEQPTAAPATSRWAVWPAVELEPAPARGLGGRRNVFLAVL